MGLFDDVLTQGAPAKSPKGSGLFNDVLGFVRSAAKATLEAPLAADRVVKSELVRLGKASQSVPSFQSVAEPLGDIVRAPLKRLNLPTGITSGFAPGTKIGNVARGMEEKSQDISIAGLADIGATNAVAKGINAVGQGVSNIARSSRVAQMLQENKILNAPVEQLVARATRSGDEGADILSTLRRRQSPKFKAVYTALQEQRQSPRGISGLLPNLSERGSVKLPRVGEVFNIEGNPHKVTAIDDVAKMATLAAVSGGKVISVPLSVIAENKPKPAPPAQSIRQSIGQANQPPTIVESRALNRSLTRQESASKEGFRTGKEVGESQEFVQGQQLLLRRSLAGQGRAFSAGERSASQSMITRTQSLAKQGRAFAAGEKYGGDVQKAELLDAFRQQSSDIKTIQQGLIQRIGQRLPLAKRGQFLNMVTQSQTKRQVLKAFQRIERESNKASKRTAIAELNAAVDEALDSPSIAIEYRQQIKAIANTIRLSGKRPETLRRLEQTRAFMEKQSALGKDVEMPKRVLESLRTLDRVDASSLSLEQIENISQEMRRLSQLGMTKQAARETLYASEKERKLNELVAGTRPIEPKAMIVREVGDPPLSSVQQLQNAIQSNLALTQRVDLSITPMDVLFDLLDGGQGYRGPNMRIFKNQIDTDFSSYLTLKEAWTNKALDLALELKLNEQNMERIAVHAYRVQPGGVQYLINSGVAEAQINAIELTPAEKRWYVQAREIIEEPFPQTVEWLRVNANRPIQKVENYWPIQTDFEAMSELEVAERLGDSMEGFRRTKNVEQGFTLSRRGGKQPIRLNALDTFSRHMDDMAYLLSMGKDIKMLAEIARSPIYGEKAGQLGQKIVVDWTDTLARKGGADGAKKIAMLDTLRRNFGAARLGFKLSSILIQPTALFDGASRLGVGVFNSFKETLVSRNIRLLARDLSAELRNRGADDPAYLELSDNPLLAKWQQKGFWLLQQADVLTATGVWWEAYKQASKRLGVLVNAQNPQKIPQAAKEADLDLRRTQASAFSKDVPQAISRGSMTGNSSFDRAVLQFKSFMLNRWSLIRHDAWRAGIKQGVLEKDPRKVLEGSRIMFWLTLATIAETGIRGGSRVLQALAVGGVAAAMSQADEEMKDFTIDVFRELSGNVPFVGDLVSMAVYRSSPIPLLGGFMDMAQGAASAVSGKKINTKIRGAVRFAEGIGGITGVSGITQAGQILRSRFNEKKSNKRSLGLGDAFATSPPADTKEAKNIQRGGGLFDDVLK